MNDRAIHLPDPAASPPPLAGQPDAALPVGMRLGAFEIQRVIARSASAVVYLATDHALSMPVAIQEYLPARLVRRDAGLRLIAAAEWHDALIDRGLRAFVDEARMLARCEHPSLLRVLQLFHSHGSAYRVMPVYAGQRLSDLCREMESAPDEAAMRALLDGLLGALETIHRSGQVHGGVSADNILLLADDRPLLLGPGAAAREIGSDLVESLMATLESPSDASRATEAEAGTPPTGAALDLYQLAAVMRFCIDGEQPVSPQALRRREPLARVIARGLPAETQQPYSAALLGALDAAVSPFAEDRPLSVAQFRDWLARGVPAVPGRGPARVAAPAVAPPVAVAAPAVSAPPPTPEPARRRGSVASHAAETEPSFAPETSAEANEPLASWPDVVRAIDPPPAAFADPAPAPLPPPLQRLTRARQRRYKWLMGGALALLAAVVLAVATGAWNLAPEIPLGPPIGRTDNTPPPAAATGRDSTVAEAPPAAPKPAAEPAVDPARTLAQEPSAAGPAPSAAASVAAAAVEPAAEAPVEVAAAAREPAPAAPPPVARATAPPAPPAARPTPRAAPPRTVAAAAPAAAPRTACAGRTEFALYRCMQQQCQAKRFAAHPQCVRLRLDDRVD